LNKSLAHNFYPFTLELIVQQGVPPRIRTLRADLMKVKELGDFATVFIRVTDSVRALKQKS
jgi:hypothetical protein